MEGMAKPPLGLVENRLVEYSVIAIVVRLFSMKCLPFSLLACPVRHRRWSLPFLPLPCAPLVKVTTESRVSTLENFVQKHNTKGCRLNTEISNLLALVARPPSNLVVSVATESTRDV